MRAIVIDDEELARAHLGKMLRDLGVEVVAEGESGLEALRLTEAHRPDILFLDIQMPDMTGLQAAANLNSEKDQPMVVFVTGYSEHALEAFDRQALDYLIKPVAPERLEQTLMRVRSLMEKKVSPDVEGFSTPELNPLKRLPVRTDYAIKLLRIDEIEFAVSRDKKVIVKTNGCEQRTYYTLSQLEELLPKDEFMRIHLSAIVRVGLIESVNFLGNHTYSVTLSGGVVLPIGRTDYADLQRRLGL